MASEHLVERIGEAVPLRSGLYGLRKQRVALIETLNPCRVSQTRIAWQIRGSSSTIRMRRRMVAVQQVFQR
jgi:hypothetical protein